MMRIPSLALGMALAAQASVGCWAAEGRPAKLSLSATDFTKLEGAHVADVVAAASGKAVLVDEPDGLAEVVVKLGERGELPQGLYNVSVQLGARDGQLKWAAVHCFPGGWFTGYVERGEAGKWRWRERAQPVPIVGKDQLVLQVRAKGETDFYIGRVTLERVEPYWPKEMISDEEFFGGLDRDCAGLRAAIAASDAGDYAKACSEFVEYLRRSPRNITGPLGGVVASQPPKKTDGPVSEAAQLLLQDRMVLRWDPHDQPNYCTCEAHKIPPTEYSFADPFEWHKIYDNPGRRWYGWFLSANLNELSSAYTSTGDERFARKAMDLIRRWIDEWGPFPKAFYAEGGYPNEYYTKGSFGHARTANCYARSAGVRNGLIEAIWNAVSTTGGCRLITDRERVEALKLALIMTRYVQNVRDYQNGVHPKYVWLIQAGNWLPEFREVVEMSDNAPWALMSFMDDCHYPDGAYNELCYHRHGRFAQAAREAQAQGKDMAKYLEKFRKCFDFNIWMTKPMGNFPWVNDSGSGDRVDPEAASERLGGYVEMAYQLYPDDPVLRYIHTRGQEGEPPLQLSRNFPWSGFMIMRTGWRPDDLQLIFDGGRNTGTHNHQDQMNIVVTAYGSTLLCDTGYVGTGFSAPDRAYYISHPRGHNLLMVDDMVQTPNYPSGENLIGWRAWGNEPLNNYWLSADGYDYAATCYDRRYRRDYEESNNYVETARQERRILFLKPSTGAPYWVVWDIVHPKDAEAGEHNLQLLFHFTPTSSAQIVQRGRAVRNTAENAGLLVLPLSDGKWEARLARGDARPEELYWQGFVSGGFGNPLMPTDCAIFEHHGSLPAAVATMLLPYPKGAPHEATAELLPASRGDTALTTAQAFGLEIELAGGRDIVMASAEPGTVTEFGNLACDGRMAVVRYDARGEVTSVMLVEGSVLRVGDDHLLGTGGRTARYVECGRGRGAAAEGVTAGARELKVGVRGLMVMRIDWQEGAEP